VSTNFATKPYSSTIINRIVALAPFITEAQADSLFDLVVDVLDSNSEALAALSSSVSNCNLTRLIDTWPEEIGAICRSDGVEQLKQVIKATESTLSEEQIMYCMNSLRKIGEWWP
jgi:hypothetical protein